MQGKLKTVDIGYGQRYKKDGAFITPSFYIQERG